MKYKLSEMINEKWKEKTLGEVTSLITKGIPPKYSEKENKTTIWVLNQKCNRNFEISYSEAKLHDCSLKKVPENRMLKNGDVLINSTGTGTAGRVAQLHNVVMPTTIDGHMILLRPTDEIDSLYYGYAIKSFQKQIEALAEGSTGQTEINRQRLQNEVIIKFPIDKCKQRKISSFLSNLDKKIKVNIEINKNLEQQAQALFNQVFPYTLEDKLPHNWVIGTVNDVIELHDSKRIPLSGFQRSKMKKRIYPYYGAASLMDYVDEYIFDGTYLLLGEDGTVVDNQGYPILQYIWGQFWVNNHAHILTGKRGFNVESLYLLFKCTPVKSIITGAVQPKISQANLKSLKIVIPPENAISEFNFTIKPIFSLIRSNQDENKSLSELKDNLLSKLMSGEIDISNLDI